MVIEIVDLPIKNGDFPKLYCLVVQCAHLENTVLVNGFRMTSHI